VRERLFPARPELTGDAPFDRRLLGPGWLVPALAGLMLTAILLPRPETGSWSLAARNEATLVTAALSNQFYGAYLAGGDHARMNPAPTQIGMDKPLRFDF
jgi:hypothetical protein